MIKRRYVVLSLLTLVSVVLGGLLYSNLVQAQTTVTGYISVSAAEFAPVTPLGKNYSYVWGEMPWRVEGLQNLEATELLFIGSVQLPHGATVTNMTFYWRDQGGAFVSCSLWRYNGSVGAPYPPPHHDIMTLSESSGEAGYGVSYANFIYNATVDNNHWAYCLFVVLPPSGAPGYYMFLLAVIEYTLPSEGAVGGMWIPVDKLGLLAPYIALVSTIILAVSISVAYVKYRKKQ